MKPQSIGLIGGAGPLAGARLFEKVLRLCQRLYGCYKDADYPEIHLLSVPFPEMLATSIDAACIRQKLQESLNRLRLNGANCLAIACNTLHAFLDEGEIKDLISLPQELAKAIPSGTRPVVLSTSTSCKYGVHKAYFPCTYLETSVQNRLDRLIDAILAGENKQTILSELNRLIAKEKGNVIVLGCTELSLFAEEIHVPCVQCIDPLEILAEAIVRKSFQES